MNKFLQIFARPEWLLIILLSACGGTEMGIPHMSSEQLSADQSQSFDALTMKRIRKDNFSAPPTAGSIFAPRSGAPLLGFVGSSSNRGINVIDAAGRFSRGSIASREGGSILVFSPDRTLVFVADPNMPFVRELSLASRTEVNRYTLPQGRYAYGVLSMDVSPDGQKLHVVTAPTELDAYLSNERRVLVIDRATAQVIETARLEIPGYVRASRNGTHIYAINDYGNRLSYFNLQTDRTDGTFDLSGYGAVNPRVFESADGSVAYIVTESDVSYLNLATLQFQRVAVSGYGGWYRPIMDAEISADGVQLYLLRYGRTTDNPPGEINLFNLATRQLGRQIALDRPYNSMEMTPDGQTLYLHQTPTERGEISVFDTTSESVVGTMNAGSFLRTHCFCERTGALSTYSARSLSHARSSSTAFHYADGECTDSCIPQQSLRYVPRDRRVRCGDACPCRVDSLSLGSSIRLIFSHARRHLASKPRWQHVFRI